MNKNLVIVVDMINGFINEGALADSAINDITPNIIEVIERFGVENTLFVADCHKEDAKEFGAFPPHCIENTSEATIIDELQPYAQANPIIYKNSTNAFHKLDITSVLKYDNIIIVGCCTDICILQLALSLKSYINEYNYSNQVIVLEDCVSTFSAPNHHALEYQTNSLNLMRQQAISVYKRDDLS